MLVELKLFPFHETLMRLSGMLEKQWHFKWGLIAHSR